MRAEARALAQIAAQDLRIIEHPAQFAAEAPAIDDDRGGNDRAGQRSAPSFVDAANDPRTAALDGDWQEVERALEKAGQWRSQT